MKRRKSTLKREHIPLCKGWTFHVFTLGSDVCSLCGWRKQSNG